MSENSLKQTWSKATEKTAKGLILSRQWHDTNQGQVLVIWIASDAGPVRIELTNQESVFFISEADIKRAQKVLDAQLAWRHSLLDLRCHADPARRAVACYFRSQRDLAYARKMLNDRDVATYEADVRPTDRYLMERFIRGTVEVSGHGEDHGRYLSFLDPRLRPAEASPQLDIVSLDIETSVTNGVILSIAVHGQDVERVFMTGSAEPGMPGLRFFADEKSLLVAFLEWFDEHDPDVVIGWSVVGFDLKFMQDRCDVLGIRFTLGRGHSEIGWRTVEQGQQRLYAVVPGRVVLDGIELLRTATYSFESFSLENVSRELLGRGKLIHDVDARAEEIEYLHANDPEALARYNLEDCALVSEIFAKTDLIDFAVQRSCLTGLEMDRQGGSVAAFDYLYLPRLHREGFVAPVVDESNVVNSPGGFVFDSKPGLYRHVAVLDFKSLYPSIIRTFLVDPLAMVAAGEDRIEGFIGASFSKRQFILPKIIEELWSARDEAKKKSDGPGSQAIKIIMNSFYGVLGTPGCRFFDPRLASSITMRGHEILQRTRDLIEEKGYPVIYGDTDSVFVLLDSVGERAAGEASALADYLNGWWQNELQQRYGIESYLELEFETHFDRFLMPTVRGSDKGSKKRYAGLVQEPGGDYRLVFKGLESVRSDWSPLAREFQQELYRRVFFDEPVDDYVKAVVRQVQAGELDDRLTLRRRLRRQLGDYTKNVPPHVKAARLADAEREKRGLKPAYEGGGWIEYRMTVNGPEPVAYASSPTDYDFYIDRQLAPIADAILGFEDKSLAELIDQQLGLF